MTGDGIKMGMTPPHPGTFIRIEALEELGLSVSAAARILGVRRGLAAELAGQMRARRPLHLPVPAAPKPAPAEGRVHPQGSTDRVRRASPAAGRAGRGAARCRRPGRSRHRSVRRNCTTAPPRSILSTGTPGPGRRPLTVDPADLARSASGGSSAARTQFGIGISRNDEAGPSASGSSQVYRRRRAAAARSAWEWIRTGKGASSHCGRMARAAR